MPEITATAGWIFFDQPMDYISRELYDWREVGRQFDSALMISSPCVIGGNSGNRNEVKP